MVVVEDLVASRASGILEITGNPSGHIYLEGGHIAYARASWVPGLAARLRAIAPSLDSKDWPSSQDAHGDVDIAWLMVRHGYLTTAGLHELIESVIIDAFLVLTIPLMEDSHVGEIHFTPISTCLTDLFPRVRLEVVRSEAVRRAERMAEYGLAPTTAVAPRDLAASATVLTREQWAVACQIGDRVSARELAMRTGASLSDTVHCLGSLVTAGLCAPVRSGGHRQAAPAVAPRARRVPPRAALEAPPPAAAPKARRVPARAALEAPPPAAAPKARRVPARAALEAPPPAVPPKARRTPAPAALEAPPPAAAPKGRRTPAPAALEAAPAAVPPQARRVPAGSHRAVSTYQPPSMDVLRQVLDGLRQLS